MSIDRAIEIFRTAMDHAREMSNLGTQRSVQAIDSALANNDREALKAANFILPSVEEQDRSRGEGLRLIKDTIADAKARLPGDSLRAFLGIPMIQQAFAKAIGEHVHMNAAVDRIVSLKTSLIADVHTGTGPLRPETVETLTELRAQIIEQGRKIATAPVLTFPEDPDERLFMTMVTFPMVVMTKWASEYQTEKTGVTALMTPAPSEADLQEFAAILGEHEATFREVAEMAAEMEEEDDELRM